MCNDSNCPGHNNKSKDARTKTAHTYIYLQLCIYSSRRYILLGEHSTENPERVLCTA